MKMRVIITFHVSYNIYAKALWSPWYGPQPEIFILKLIKVYVLLVFWKFPVWVNSIFGAASGSLSFLSGIRKLSRGVNLPKSQWLFNFMVGKCLTVSWRSFRSVSRLLMLMWIFFDGKKVSTKIVFMSDCIQKFTWLQHT